MRLDYVWRWDRDLSHKAGRTSFLPRVTFTRPQLPRPARIIKSRHTVITVSCTATRHASPPAMSGTSTSTQHAVLKLIRRVKNRCCADCSALLIPHECYCSQMHLVWICHACALVHNQIDQDGSLVHALADPSMWRAGVLKAIALTSNELQNRTLERHIPPGWIKPTPNSISSSGSSGGGSQSASLLREAWVKAKYRGRLFLWPSLVEAATPVTPDSTTPRSPHVVAPPDALPPRLIDFFALVGPVPLVEPAAAIPTAPLNVSPTSVPGHSWPVSCDDFAVPCGIQFSCPQSQPDTHLPPLIGDFIFPLGMRLQSEEPAPQVITFVLTDVSRVKLYGTALIFYELLEPEELGALLGVDAAAISAAASAAVFPDAASAGKAGALGGSSRGVPPWSIVFAPKAVTILSHYPFFHAFSVALRELYHASLSACPIPLERYIANIALETPLPPLGVTEVAVSLAHTALVIYRPPQVMTYRPIQDKTLTITLNLTLTSNFKPIYRPPHLPAPVEPPAWCGPLLPATLCVSLGAAGHHHLQG